ncbi:MAG TPA: hypothetical protein VKQ71_03610 [Acidimicrobiales bacterium]|nr:hypothetical protein [Acidimicrobiales bacterium]
MAARFTPARLKAAPATIFRPVVYRWFVLDSETYRRRLDGDFDYAVIQDFPDTDQGAKDAAGIAARLNDDWMTRLEEYLIELEARRQKRLADWQAFKKKEGI